MAAYRKVPGKYK